MYVLHVSEVADKTSSWDNNSNPVASSVGTGGGVDARMAAQALLSPQSLDRSHGGKNIHVFILLYFIIISAIAGIILKSQQFNFFSAQFL